MDMIIFIILQKYLHGSMGVCLRNTEKRVKMSDFSSDIFFCDKKYLVKLETISSSRIWGEEDKIIKKRKGGIIVYIKQKGREVYSCTLKGL